MPTSELSAEALSQSAKVDLAKWSALPSVAVVEKTAAALTSHGFQVHVVEDGPAALRKVQALIPEGAEVMNGSSTTLIEIGFLDWIKGSSGRRSTQAEVNAEQDPQKRSDLRRKSVTAEWFCASVNAVTETGELVAADKSGSRVGAMPFAAKNLVVVVGTNKIVPSVDQALARLREYAYPLENARAQRVYKMESAIAKILIFAMETIPNRTTVVLVKQALGY